MPDFYFLYDLLENVSFYIDDVLNHFVSVGSASVSDTKGESKLNVWLPGCPDVKFEVYAQPPANYRATTPIRVAVPKDQAEMNFKFGFTYIDGAPSPTPRPEGSLACTSFDFNEKDSFSTVVVTDIAFDSEGKVWATTNADRVYVIDPNSGKKVIYTTKDGLLDGVARAVAITKRGTVWVGTNHGVSQFDGKKWTSYSLPSGWVNDILVTQDDSVWIATEGAIAKFDPVNNQWNPNFVKASDLTSDYAIEGLVESSDQSIWMLSNASVYQFIPAISADEQSKLIAHQQNGGTPYRELVAIRGKASGYTDRLWFIGSSVKESGLYSYDLASKRWQVFNHTTTGGAMSGGQLFALAVAPDKSLWMSIYKQGLVHFIPDATKADSGAWLSYTTEEATSKVIVPTLRTDSQGNIWIGSEAGILSRCTETRK